MAGKVVSNLPPGFRFHPTDEELIVHYLKNQAMSQPCPVSIIPEVDIYKFDPWQLPDKGGVGEKEWYFFSPRDRKYPNGVRPNRATVSGYWKATGTDKAIYSGTKCAGIKKALVFYQGRPPKGNKTDWIMHEYRLSESRPQPTVKHRGSMRLDDWVLCRIYKKKHAGRTPDQKLFEENSQRQAPPMTGTNLVASTTTNQDSVQHQLLQFRRTGSLGHLLDMDYLGPVSHMFSDNNPFSSGFELQGSVDRSRYDLAGGERSRLGEIPYAQYSDPTTMTTILNQQNGLQYDNPLSKLA
ncbi:hypothetical protein Droror1_Dr00008242 [Drosera rotundifolia]